MSTASLDAIESAILLLRSSGHHAEAQRLEAANEAVIDLFESSEVLAACDYGRNTIGGGADRKMHVIRERHRAAVRRLGGAV